MMPRLPVNMPRCGVAMMSPCGVTRFCSGMVFEVRCQTVPSLRGAIATKQSTLPAYQWIASLALAMTTTSRRAVADRRLERQRGVPWKENPGVLRYFGDEGVDQRPSLRLGVDGCEMRRWQHVTHQPCGLAGIDEIVNDQQSLAGPAAKLCDLGRYALQNLEVAACGVIVAGNADGIDHADAKLARDDAPRHCPAAGDRDHRVNRPDLVQPPGQRPAIPVELVPRDRKGLARPLLRAQFRMLRHHHSPTFSVSRPWPSRSRRSCRSETVRCSVCKFPCRAAPRARRLSPARPSPAGETAR